MNVRELAEKKGFDPDDFEKFALEKSGLKVKSAYGGARIDDSQIDSLVSKYEDNNPEAAKQKAAEMEALAAEEAKKKKAMAEMLITSGFSFDGYKIKKYSGYISGDDAVSVDRGFFAFGMGIDADIRDKLMASLVEIRRNALRELKEAAYDLGCNAVIGVDFDYLTLDPQTAHLGGGTTYQPYIFGVTANGNAVVIEKVDDDD